MHKTNFPTGVNEVYILTSLPILILKQLLNNVTRTFVRQCACTRNISCVVIRVCMFVCALLFRPFPILSFFSVTGLGKQSWGGCLTATQCVYLCVRVCLADSCVDGREQPLQQRHTHTHIRPISASHPTLSSSNTLITTSSQ